MNDLLKWAQGNPGAMHFLMEVFTNPNTDFGDAAIIDGKLRECTSLRGTNIYILYSDLCGKDISKVVALCKKCPSKILEDACNRQDYSGRELVAEYFEDTVAA